MRGDFKLGFAPMLFMLPVGLAGRLPKRKRAFTHPLYSIIFTDAIWFAHSRLPWAATDKNHSEETPSEVILFPELLTVVDAWAALTCRHARSGMFTWHKRVARELRGVNKDEGRGVKQFPNAADAAGTLRLDRDPHASGESSALAGVVPLFSAGPPANDASLKAAAIDVAVMAFARAGEYDFDGAYPSADVAALHESGLLTASLPLKSGGDGLDGPALADILRVIGFGSLPLGRLFEGHVNAIALISKYGSVEQTIRASADARAGKLHGVWNTDDKAGLRLIAERGRFRLEGRKILASGAGYIERPIVTATDRYGRRLMVMPHLRVGERADLSTWRAHGMRASATGAIDFSDLVVEPDQILGDHGDYERQPAFSGGAWRFAAVHLGGMERLLDLLREHLRNTGRGSDPYQAARLGEAAIAAETAHLWVTRAAALASDAAPPRPAEQIVAYVNLARLAVERGALDLSELVHRSVGLQGFMRPSPIERVSRDLATYLRQPGPDRALANAAAWVLENAAASRELWS